MDGESQHASCRVTANGFQFVYYPSFNLICKLGEADILFILIVRFTVYLYVIPRELTGELNVQTSLANGQ
jgi:hypothetical protein